MIDRLQGENPAMIARLREAGALPLSGAAAVLRILRRIVDIVAILLLLGMVSLIFIQILGRYAFNFSISWSEECATFAQIWLVMLGAGIAMRNRHHVGIDLLVVRCPLNVQRVVKAAGFLLSAWFLVVVIVGSFSLLALGMIVKSPALQLPLAVPYSALPVGMGYFLLEFAIATLPEIHDPRSAPSNQGGEIE